jgi:hypothetical protein
MAVYIHKKPGDEVQALAWSYILLDEGRISVNGRELIYEICEATVGSPCAGIGTLRFIYVPGFVREWKKYGHDGGNPVSLVEPVSEEPERSRVREALSGIHPSLQVCF